MKKLSWDKHKNHKELLAEFYHYNKFLISEQLKDALLDAIECMEYVIIEEGASKMSETELKPCPFCGGTKLKIDSKRTFRHGGKKHCSVTVDENS